MPEDTQIKGLGFRFIGGDNGTFIANERAVLETFDVFANRIANETAFDHLGQAREAVQAATRRKPDLPDDPSDNPDLSDFVPEDEF